MTDTPLPRCTPESQGIASAAVLAFVDEAQRSIHELHSFMLLRRGAVIAEGWWSPYGPHLPHMLFSLSKSFTSTAVGLAAAEGLLSVSDPVISFFPEDAPTEPSENLRAMRVKQLLSMSTGHAEDTTGRITGQPDPNWVKAFLALPVEYRPGTHFVYNSGATYMLSAIVQKVTGCTVLDYLTPRLFEPLGIHSPTWENSPQGINMGGWGLNVTTEDIARFGQLYLQKGKWNGAQIVPETWVAEASSRQVSNGCSPDSDWEQGYGYQFWRCRHNCYRGDGAFGQYCIVMPDQDAVLAITSGVGDMQQVLNLVWDRLLPAMGPAPLVADPAEQAALQERLSGLKIDPPAGAAASPLAAQVSGRAYRVEENQMGIQSVSLDFSGGGCILHVEGAAQNEVTGAFQRGMIVGSHQVSCGMGAWQEGETNLFGSYYPQCLASAVWTADGTCALTIRMVRTPFYYTITCKFAGDRLEMQLSPNVAFDPEPLPVLVGRA